MDRIRGAGTGHTTPFVAGNHKPAQVVIGGRGFEIPIMSMKARRWQTVVRQQHDISCGAAVVATLLTHHYAIETSEKTVFESMLERGDQAKIKKFGFSLLDMKNYLHSRGLRAEGYRASIEKLASVGVPAIILLNLKGYRHFVLIKGIENGRVLVGDPAFGLKIYDLEEFKKLLVNDIVFVLLDHGQRGKAGFNRKVEWAHLGKAPIEMARDMATLQSIFRISLPSTNEF